MSEMEAKFVRKRLSRLVFHSIQQAKHPTSSSEDRSGVLRREMTSEVLHGFTARVVGGTRTGLLRPEDVKTFQDGRDGGAD